VTEAETKRHVPIRTCAGCGRRAPKGDLVRFVARDGDLVPERRAPGRGAYTCRRLVCFEQAVVRRGFARTLRQGVRVDPALAHLYTAEADG